MSTDAVHHVSFREIDSVFAGWSEPATASISRPVTTADIGDERSPATGCSARVALIRGRRSGEALRTSQYARWPSPQAKPATARSRHLPARPGTQTRCSSTAGNPHRPQTEHNRINMGCLAGSAGLRKRRDYLISAQAYALISSPTAISMMTGVFHFIAVLLDLILTGGKSRVAAKRRRIRRASPTGRGVRLSYDTFWRFLRLSRVHSASTFDNTAWSE